MESVRVLLLLTSLSALICCHNPASNQLSGQKHTNQLIHTSSPYLLQHAHNPVDWYPWGEEALEKARSENKMLLISIGYAACHWCHVMEHESFEDTTVAKIMNEHFVSIKVDREERPDIDAIYMTACQMASDGSCGWPLNSFALPDGRPVWAGTYFPKKQWIEILKYFIDLRQQSPEKLETYADELAAGMKQLETIEPVPLKSSFPVAAAEQPLVQFLKDIDPRYGGRKGLQKFPMPNNYEWLLAYHQRTGLEDPLVASVLTLDNMANGGIYDQIGGGFARYATDTKWRVPHFEKMLYDNAQLVSLYAKAYQLTKNERYLSVMTETLDFIERELTANNGGFYSSLDADSDGEEGKYYVWTQNQIDSILSPTEARLVTILYNTSRKGNWEMSKNILYRQASLASVAEKLSMETEAARGLLQSANEKLMKARTARVRPGLDDKILCSWNGLMLEGYTDAYRATGREAYRETALKNAEFIVENMLGTDGRLQRNFKDGKTSINAFLDDYAHTAKAFVALYEITFDEEWLTRAKLIADYTLTHFRDEASGFFFYTSDLDPPLLVRKIELEDNVIPSSNSSMARVLLRLGHYYYDGPYREISQHMMNGIQVKALESEHPSFYSNWNQLYLELAEPIYEVAIIGPEYDELRRELQKEFRPDALYLGGASEGRLSLLKNKLVSGETFVYVCLDRVCKLPVKTAEDARELMF